MNTFYVLIMLFGGYSSQSGMTSITQEFHTFEACEIARKHLEASANPQPGAAVGFTSVRAQGCFKK